MQAEPKSTRRIPNDVCVTNFRSSDEKLQDSGGEHEQVMALSYNMEGYAQKCVERHCELANKNIKQLYMKPPHLVSTTTKLETVGELSKVCFHIVLKCLFLARIGSPDSKPIWRNSVTFWKSILCSSQLDAQEADSSLTQFNGV